MKFLYENHANEPGIYKIINIQTNRFYVGQCGQFKERWFGHKASLLKNKDIKRGILKKWTVKIQEQV